MVVKAFRALGHNAQPYARYYGTKNEWVESEPFDGDWDLLLFMECNDGEPQYRELSLTRARKTACWFFDTSYYPDHLTGLARAFNFDYQFIANPLDVSKFENGHYLPYACDPDLHIRYDIKRLCRMSLFGSIRQDREELRDALKSRGIHLDLVGGLFREEYIDALASSTITLNQNPTAGRGLLNMRFWEAQAAGSIVFTEESDLLDNLSAGLQHVACYTYSSIDDIVSHYNRLMESENERKIVVSMGQDRALTYHTYENRCSQILETVF
jgi:hypothetical protein